MYCATISRTSPSRLFDVLLAVVVLSASAAPSTRRPSVLKVFLHNVIRDAVTYTEHGRRKIVTAMDVVYVIKRQGRTLYGFGT
jgi:histone H3/H4